MNPGKWSCGFSILFYKGIAISWCLHCHTRKNTLSYILSSTGSSKVQGSKTGWFLLELRDLGRDFFPPFQQGLVTCAQSGLYFTCTLFLDCTSGEVFCEIYSFRPSKLLLLDNLKMSFSPGDLIWAKMRGYPHWPARVSTTARWYFGIKAKLAWLLIIISGNSSSFVISFEFFFYLHLDWSSCTRREDSFQEISNLLLWNTRDVSTPKVFL